MKRRFIISTETLSPDKEAKLKTEIGSVIWWHWLPNTWLIIDTSDTVSVSSLRDAVRRVSTSTECLVLEVDHKSWSALTRKTVNGRLSDWVKKNWADE